MQGICSGIYWSSMACCHKIHLKQSTLDTMFADTSQGLGTQCSLTNLENMYIFYGKAKGGLKGLTLLPDQSAYWVLSYHMCNMV